MDSSGESSGDHHQDLVPAIPKVQDHPESAPTSEQVEDDLEVDHHSPIKETNEPDGGNHEDDDRSQGGRSENVDVVDASDKEPQVDVVMLTLDSSEEVQSGEKQGSSNTHQSESTGSGFESSFETGEESRREDEPDGEEQNLEQNVHQPGESQTEDAGQSSKALTDGFSSSGPGRVDVPLLYDVGVPRPCSWVAESLLQTRSFYERGENMSAFVKKLSI